MNVFSEKMKKRHWQLWYALRGKGCVTSTTNPTLFEVVWYPLLSALSNRSFRSDYGLRAPVASLWRDWKSDNLPWRLRRKVADLRERLRKARRENLDLRQQLAEMRKQKDEP